MHAILILLGKLVALKPTIYKFRVALTDMNRDHYDSLNLTIAQHPSENTERMMARVLAFCLNAREGLVFTKGLSEVDEPDIWVREYDDSVSLWIDAGEPDADRMKKKQRVSQKKPKFIASTQSQKCGGNKTKVNLLLIQLMLFVLIGNKFKRLPHYYKERWIFQ